MIISFARQRKLANIAGKAPELSRLKSLYKIAVVDDDPFAKATALAAHNFQLAELGDIRRIEQIAEYPIVVCDIRGVGAAFGSPLEGAHVIAEMRKAYPDKFLVAYSGAESDMSYNDLLRSVDLSVPKDARTEVWVSVLEKGLREVGDPHQRWIRLRNQLSVKGIDALEIFRLEQAYLRALDKRDHTILENVSTSLEAQVIVKEFAKVALAQLIKFGLTAAVA